VIPAPPYPDLLEGGGKDTKETNIHLNLIIVATKKVYEWEFDLGEYLMTSDVLEDYVARMKTRRSLAEDDLIGEITVERTDIRPETFRLCNQLMSDKIIKKVCDGHIVSTATATYVPTILGVFLGTSNSPNLSVRWEAFASDWCAMWRPKKQMEQSLRAVSWM
jgi:hypothetical protein